MTEFEQARAESSRNAPSSLPHVDLSAFGLICFLVGLTACTVQTPLATPITSSTPPPTATVARAADQVPSSSTLAPGLGATRTITLTIWAPEEFAPGTTRSGQVLQRQVDEFSNAHPDIKLNFVLKNRYGPGGLLDFLLKVQSLVPGRLPDMVLMDSRELDTAAEASLFQPLDKDLPAGAFADLLPPAQSVARYNGVWVDLPLTLELEHLAYNSQTVHEPPATWEQMLANRSPFAFPAGGDDSFWLQYLDNNGRLPNPHTPTALDISAATTVFTFYQRARAANLIPDSVFGLKSVSEVWPIFVAGQAPLAQVEAGNYWGDSNRVANAAYAPLPTRDGRATTLANTWSYAIITADAQRHAAAAEFLSWIDDPARVGEWAAAAHLLPARRSAFALAVSPRAYAEFNLRLTDAAIVAPTFAQRAPFAAGITGALQMVLRGQATPGEAALKAAQPATP